MSFVGKWFGFGKNPHHDEGIRCFERRDFEAAIELFRICLASDPEPGTRDRCRNYLAGSLGNVARDLIKANQLSEALTRLSEAVHVRPRFADLHRLRAYVFALTGDWNSADESVNAALELNPLYGHALALKAAIECHANLAEASQTAERARKADPRLDEATLGKAKDAIQAHKFEQARDLLLNWNPTPIDPIDSTVDQADVLMKKRKYAQAELLYREAIEIQPRFADLRLKHGQSLFELNQLDQALSEFREASSINPNFGEAHALIGITLRRLGDEEGAREAFIRTVQIEPEHPIASAELMRLRL